METEKNIQPVIEKPVKLTKKGVPDRRGETSRKNLEKGKSIIKQALKEIKIKQEKPLKDRIAPNAIFEKEDYSSDNYSTDEEEVELEQGSAPARRSNDEQVKEPVKEPVKEVQIGVVGVSPTPIISPDYSFSFEKKLNEQIEKLNNDYNLKITNIEKKTKEELDYLKKTNQELKKHLTTNFRTHQGVLNQEMFLKF